MTVVEEYGLLSMTVVEEYGLLSYGSSRGVWFIVLWQ